MWDGLFAVLVVPSPKLHSRLVIVPVEASVKLTARGAVPLVGVAVKPAATPEPAVTWKTAVPVNVPGGVGNTIVAFLEPMASEAEMLNTAVTV